MKREMKINVELTNDIENIFGKEKVRYNELMSKHTSFKVGGPADIFIECDSEEKLSKLMEIVDKHDVPITVVGNGSNLIVRDNGIRGIVLKYTARNLQIEEEEHSIKVTADAGMMNAKLAYDLLKKEIGGFEELSGIPGTLGGAICMNAGAYGKEIKDIIKNVTYLDLNDRKIYTLENEKCEFSYRKSIFLKKHCIILKAEIELYKSSEEDIKKKIEEQKEKRINSQPLDMPSAGSTFKRGDGFITAKLIDEAGLKGKKIGGAEVSKKHAGFIVNSGNATAEDIINLIKYVQDEVYKKFNKKIETEVRIIGE